ncbi:MAG: HAD-IIB family hydrolase [Oricola sp.]
MRPPAIVFTDLDGTLLDHATYAWDSARPALTLLREHGIPLILASSKTAAEIADLRAEIGFPDCPAIVENGAGILEPGDPAIANDASVHDRLVAILDALPLRLRENFSGFSDWAVEEVAAKTGLSLPAAKKAAARRFSEPGIWSGTNDERAEFEAQLAGKGVTARQGGRYLTLSFGASKADRMADIASRYGGAGDRPRVIALGDAPNDIEMLQAADIGVIVANPHGKALPELAGERDGRIVRTEKSGPEGWNESVQRILQDL